MSHTCMHTCTYAHMHTQTHTHLEVLHEVVLVVQDSQEVLAGLPVTAINQGLRRSYIIIMKLTYINMLLRNTIHYSTINNSFLLSSLPRN